MIIIIKSGIYMKNRGLNIIFANSCGTTQSDFWLILSSSSSEIHDISRIEIFGFLRKKFQSTFYIPRYLYKLLNYRL